MCNVVNKEKRDDEWRTKKAIGKVVLAVSLRARAVRVFNVFNVSRKTVATGVGIVCESVSRNGQLRQQVPCVRWKEGPRVRSVKCDCHAEASKVRAPAGVQGVSNSRLCVCTCVCVYVCLSVCP